jgi:hypothetical protein
VPAPPQAVSMVNKHKRATPNAVFISNSSQVLRGGLNAGYCLKQPIEFIAGVVLKWVSAGYDGNGGTAASVTVTPQFSGTVISSVSFYDGTTVVKTVSMTSALARARPPS